jgi:predicted MFS family arabinose efflux permease
MMDHDRRTPGIAPALFLSLFAAQAALIALSPVLATVAADLHVSTAAAGQLRTVSGLAAGLTALSFGRIAARIGLRTALVAGAGLLALASLASAAAPTFLVLAGVQLLVGVAVALLVAGGTAAVAEWAPAERRSRVLARVMVGSPAAWIVGMPLSGQLGALSWRYTWIGLPLAASLLAGALVLRGPDCDAAPRRGGLREALSDGAVGGWLAGELLATSAWLGTLVYSGALFVQSYGLSPGAVGLILAAGAGAYVVGTLSARKAVERDARGFILRTGPALACAVVLFGVLRPGAVASGALFALAAAIAGARILAGNAAGLAVAPELRVGAVSARAAAQQFGYFVGPAVAGAALAAGGYAGVGLASGALLLLATAAPLVHVDRTLPLLRARLMRA